MKLGIACFCLILTSNLSLADGPTDNSATSVREVPPPGIAIRSEKRFELAAAHSEFISSIEKLKSIGTPLVVEYLPDVEIVEKALRVALHENGFFAPKDVDDAIRVLAVGEQRLP